MRINNQGYLESAPVTARCRGRRKEKDYRNRWLAKSHIYLGMLSLPKKHWGKRIRFKVEFEE